MEAKTKQNGMYMLLLAAAVLVVGSIWFACSSDDEFESNYEMETLAEGSLSMNPEQQAIIYNKHTSPINIKVGFAFTGNDVDSCLISYQLDCDDTYDHFKMTILSYTPGVPGYEVHGYMQDYGHIDGNYRFELTFYATKLVNNTPFASNQVSYTIIKQENDFH